MEKSQQLTFTQHQPKQGIGKPTVGVLLVHGLNGSKRDMEELAVHLTEHGMITENILLPGHGTRVQDMFPLGWPEWSTAVRHELHALQQRCDLVFLVGHSLGGALCLHSAAHEKVAGVVTLCAPLHMFPWLKPAVRMIKRITPVLPTIREDICDPDARKRHTRDVYRWTPMAPVESMLHHLPKLCEELPQITVPVLIMHAIHDHVVPARDGREIYRLLGCEDKHLIILRRSYHVVMKDHDREEVFTQTLSFIQRLSQTQHAAQERTA